MSITHEYQVTGVRRDQSTCKRCGATLSIALVVSGSAGIPDRVDRRDEMDELVAPSLTADYRRTRGLVQCPSCKQRAPGAVALSVARVTVWIAAVPVLPIIAPGPLDILAVIPVALGLVAIASAFSERARWRRAAAAHVMLLTPGKPPRAELPAARAIAAPPAPRTVPLVSAPPPVQSPRDAAQAAEPSILTSGERE